MPNTYFSFKNFTVQQEYCAMKVCTDSCIFGAWAGPEKKEEKMNVLDIGTGTGLLSLMLAQRFENIFIDAVEIDVAATKQATENFANSPWIHRLNAIHADIQHFSGAKKYDFIICNPPFFHKYLKSPDENINKARHVHSMDENVLIKLIDQLVSPKGRFALMLPFVRREIYIQTAEKMGWFPLKELWLQQTPAHIYFRLMVQFEKKAAITTIQKICIKEMDNHYSDSYYELMKDYLR
ncbi:MAG: methyltransferase [Chitinophagaceae bacterium]